MKLIIDIPEDIVVDIKDTYTGDDVLYCAVKYGTPFDDAKYHEEHGEVIVAKEVWEDAERALRAIEDIKTEIISLTCKQYNRRITLDREEVLSVIDKHISGEPQERSDKYADSN